MKSNPVLVLPTGTFGILNKSHGKFVLEKFGGFVTRWASSECKVAGPTFPIRKSMSPSDKSGVHADGFFDVHEPLALTIEFCKSVKGETC